MVIYRNEKSPETTTSKRLRETYQTECEQMLCDSLGAKYAFTLHHATRYGKKNPKGVEYLTAYATFAHTDYTQEILDGAKSMAQKRGVPVPELDKLDFRFVNLWQPVDRAVEQHPLALLDASTLHPDDVKAVSLGYSVTPKGSGKDGKANRPAEEAKPASKKNFAPSVGQLVHNSAHQWYYYPRLTPDEILVFTQCDSAADTMCFHTAFWDPTAPENPSRRKSIELHLVPI